MDLNGKATPEKLTIVALFGIAMFGMVLLGAESKDFVIAIGSGLVGYLTKGEDG